MWSPLVACKSCLVARVVDGLAVLERLEEQAEAGGDAESDDAGHVEEQGALRLVAETRLTAETALLGNAGQTERLARESGENHVAVRDVVRIDLRDVSGHGLGKPVVCAVGAGGELVPLGQEYGMTAGRGEATANTADASEQVNGAEIRAGLVRGAVVQLLQCRNIGGLALNLARLPALHDGRGQAERFSQLASGHALTQFGDQLVGIINGLLRNQITHREKYTSLC